MKRIVILIFVLILTIFTTACGSAPKDTNDYKVPSEVLNEFESDRVDALEKYEKGEEIYFKNVFLSFGGTKSIVFLNDSREVNNSIFSNYLYLNNDNNLLDEYIFRNVDIKAKFIEYHDDSFGINIEFEIVEVIMVHDVEVTYTLEEMNDLAQSEYYNMIGKIVLITGVYHNRGYCSPSITNEDESINIKLEKLNDFCRDFDEGAIMEVLGYFVESSYDIDSIYVSTIAIKEGE